LTPVPPAPTPLPPRSVKRYIDWDWVLGEIYEKKNHLFGAPLLGIKIFFMHEYDETECRPEKGVV